MEDVMLSLEGINIYYGAIHALKDVSLEVRKGEIVTLLGANGAGKTSTLRTISGLIAPKSGSVKFEGNDLTKVAPKNIVKMGLGHVPEGRRIFGEMSVFENLQMGAYIRKDKQDIKDDMDRIFDIFPILRERRSQIAGTLSGGEQQMLAIGRALMAKPKMLMLDEPSMGLAPILVQEIFNIIQRINNDGTTVLLIEQNANMALKIAHRAYVLEVGKITLSGDADELSKSEEVKKAYLGG